MAPAIKRDYFANRTAICSIVQSVRVSLMSRKSRSTPSGTILLASQLLVVTVMGEEYFWRTGKDFTIGLIELKRESLKCNVNYSVNVIYYNSPQQPSPTLVSVIFVRLLCIQVDSPHTPRHRNSRLLAMVLSIILMASALGARSGLLGTSAVTGSLRTCQPQLLE